MQYVIKKTNDDNGKNHNRGTTLKQSVINHLGLTQFNMPITHALISFVHAIHKHIDYSVGVKD